MNTTPKCFFVKKQLAEDLVNGKHGPSGSRFLSVRRLAKAYNISIVTAQQVMTLLREDGLITLYGNAHYVAVGQTIPQSPLQQRVLKKHHINLIGIHIPELKNPFFSSLANEVFKRIEAAGYIPILMTSHRKPEIEKTILATFLSLGVKGVISCPNSGNTLHTVYRQYPLPLVFLATRFLTENQDSATVDDSAAAKHVADHLLDMQYEHFLYIGLESAWTNDFRRTAFIEQLTERGKTVPEDCIVAIPDQDDFSLPPSVSRLLQQKAKPLGIFCFHDMIAVQVILLCEKLGLNIPEDVGVVGFDNLPIAIQCRPKLTSIAYRFDKMADSAVNLLLHNIAHPSETRNEPEEYINHSLKIRESTRKAL